MATFKSSLLFVGWTCACLASPLFLFAPVAAHMTVRPEWAKSLSQYFFMAGLVLLILGIYGMVRALTSNPRVPLTSVGRPNWWARGSIVLSFPLLGLMTFGITSLLGIALGIIGLRKACLQDGLGGKGLAILGICISFGVFPLMLTLLLFLGP
jgi:hypothetical protein